MSDRKIFLLLVVHQSYVTVFSSFCTQVLQVLLIATLIHSHINTTKIFSCYVFFSVVLFSILVFKQRQSLANLIFKCSWSNCIRVLFKVTFFKCLCCFFALEENSAGWLKSSLDFL